jgi:ribosomal protein S18 acetylase RimI-like enzyme
MHIRQATLEDCPAIAEHALMAGEGMPAYFWETSRAKGESLIDVGARKAASETENYSWRNAWLALIDEAVAGLLLAYRLPDVMVADEVEEYPAFLRPLIELEQRVPGSFYINMLATRPDYRGRGVGTALMGVVDRLANDAGCRRSSLVVFEQNTGALRLYRRLGYEITDRRVVLPHACHPYTGEMLLLTRAVA